MAITGRTIKRRERTARESELERAEDLAQLRCEVLANGIAGQLEHVWSARAILDVLDMTPELRAAAEEWLGCEAMRREARKAARQGTRANRTP